MGLILNFNQCHVSEGKKKSTIILYWLLVGWYKVLRTKLGNFIWNSILTARKGKPSHLIFPCLPRPPHPPQIKDASTPRQLFQLINQMALWTHTKASSPQIHKLLVCWVTKRAWSGAKSQEVELVTRVYERAIYTEVLFWGWCLPKHHFLTWAKPFLPAQLMYIPTDPPLLIQTAK